MGVLICERLINVEIQYVKDTSSQPCDEMICVRGCDVCGSKLKNSSRSKSAAMDIVEEFDPFSSRSTYIRFNIYHKTSEIDLLIKKKFRNLARV
jgi:hypothetical protein